MATTYSDVYIADTDWIIGVADQARRLGGTTEKLDDAGILAALQGAAGKPKLQEKDVTVTFGATTYVEPDEGYDGLSYVSIVSEAPKSEEITVTPTDAEQVIYPNYDGGYQYISKVTVAAAAIGETLQSAMEVGF